MAEEDMGFSAWGLGSFIRSVQSLLYWRQAALLQPVVQGLGVGRGSLHLFLRGAGGKVRRTPKTTHDCKDPLLPPGLQNPKILGHRRLRDGNDLAALE